MTRVCDCDGRVFAGFMASAFPLTPTGKHLPLSILYYFPISTFGRQYFCITSFKMITVRIIGGYFEYLRKVIETQIFPSSSSLPFQNWTQETLKDPILCKLYLIRIKFLRPNFCNVYSVSLFITSLLRENSCTIKFTYLKCTIKQFEVYAQSYVITTTSKFRISSPCQQSLSFFFPSIPHP